MEAVHSFSPWLRPPPKPLAPVTARMFSSSGRKSWPRARNSWGTSAALAAVSFGSGRRCAPVIYGRSCWLRLGLSAAALLAGVCADLLLAPALLGMILERIL